MSTAAGQIRSEGGFRTHTAGIDIGTTSLAVTIWDASSGLAVHTATAPNRAWLPAEHPWEKLQDPELIASDAAELLEQCRPWRGKLAGIGISSQMHGVLYADGHGRAVSPLYTWQDARGGRARAGEGAGGESHASMLSRLSGSSVYSGYGSATHSYNRENGLVPDGAAWLCTIGDYVAMRLCGAREPVMDATQAAAVGLFELESGSFDAAAIIRADMDPSMFPRVAAAAEEAAVGSTHDGIPVYAAIGDSQAGFIGGAGIMRGTLLVTIGTGAQIALYSEERVSAAGLESRPMPGGGWLLTGAALAGGKSYELLERFLREAAELAGGVVPERLYSRMNEAAEAELDRLEREGIKPELTVSPLWLGSRSDPEVSGSITGIREGGFTVPGLIAGFLLGTIDELLGMLAPLPAGLRAGIVRIAGTGNGIRRNPAMRRLLAARTGLTLRTAAMAEESAAGAALHAAVYCGLYRNHEQAMLAAGNAGGELEE
ncbi:sedoheptulokinase [Paenibacillus sp. D51F]